MSVVSTNNLWFSIFWWWTVIKLLRYLKSPPSTLRLCKTLRRKKNAQILDKKCLFWMFWTGITKQCCHIWNRQLQIFLFGKLHEKAKMPNHWSQECLLWMFLVKNLETIFPYLKLSPSNLSLCKISQNNTNASITDQKCLTWVFLSWVLKTILWYLKSASPNLSNSKIWRYK